MSNKTSKLLPLSMLAVLSSSSLYAINGIYDYGMGQINRGMGGAGVAMPQDAFATFTNPAGLGQIKHNLDIGAAVYFPDMYTKFSSGTAAVPPPAPSPIAAAAGKFDSKMNVFFLPDLSYVFHLDNNNHFALAAHAIGGYGSKYQTKKSASTYSPTPLPFGSVVNRQGLLGDGTVLASLKIGSVNASYNYVVDKFFSWGVTLSYYVQAFESKGSQGLAAFTTRSLLNSNNTALATKLSNNGVDYNHGFGATLGALVKPHKMVTLGVTATPTVRMSKLKDYTDLMADGGRLDIPGRYVAGARIQPNDQLDVVVDFVRIMNRQVKTYGNNSRALIDGRCSTSSATFAPQDCLGGKEGAGFGWANQTLVKVGGAYKLTTKDTVRLGVSYGNRIGHTKDIIINTLAPGAAARWITSAGYSRVMPNYKLNSFLTYIPAQKMDGVNELSSGRAQTVEFKVGGFGLGVGVSV